MGATILYTLLICYIYLFTSTSAVSACSEIDITFIIDKETILNLPSDTSEFIDSIIDSGSAEHSGFSVIIYGDDIEDSRNIQLITLEETTPITQREKQEKEVRHKLDTVFYNMDRFDIKHRDSKETKKPKTKSVKLLDAFQKATKQQPAEKAKALKNKLNMAQNDHKLNIEEDNKVYFVFDFDNNLIKKDKDQLCALFKHLDNNKIKNDDEQIHFLLGEPFDVDNDILSIQCDGKTPSQISMGDENTNYDTFYEFNYDLLEDAELMEEIFSITCPATIKVPAFDGDINLGNHNQWIDFNTIIKCNLECYANRDSPNTCDELEVDDSYILVKDYLNDDNTFKVNDYLLANEKTFNLLKATKGCIEAVYKIVYIEDIPDEDVKYKAKKNEPRFNIIKVHVQLPKNPMEYISNCKVHGDIAMTRGGEPATKKGETGKKNDKKDKGVAKANIMDDDYLQNYNYFYDDTYDEMDSDTLDGDYELFFWDSFMDEMDGLMRQNQYYYDNWYSKDEFLNELFDHVEMIKYYMQNEGYENENNEMREAMNWGVKKAWKSVRKGVSSAARRAKSLARAAARRAKAAARAAARRAAAMARAARRRAAALARAARERAKKLADAARRRAAAALRKAQEVARRVKERAIRLANEAKRRAIAAAKAAKEKLKRAAEAAKRKAMELARKAKEAAIRIARKAKEKAMALARKAREAAKKAANMAKEALKRGGKFIKGVAKKLANKIMNALDMKLGIKGSRKLLNIHKKGDYKWEKTKPFNKRYVIGHGITITTNGKAMIKIEYGYWFKLEISLSFNFFWRILRGNIHVEFKIHGLWELGAYFNAKIYGELMVEIANILNIGRQFTFFIGPVPVIVKPYITLSAKLEVIPIEVYGGVRCAYGEKWALGYYYDKKQGKKYPIQERIVTSKYCKKKFGIGNEEEHKMYPEECPVAELGFDLTVNLQMGVKLYEIVNIFVRFELVIPFRITIPEMEPTICGLPAETDVCTTQKHLSVSFTIAVILNIYRGCTVEMGGLGGMISNMLKPGRRLMIGDGIMGNNYNVLDINKNEELNMNRRRLIMGEKLIKKIDLIKKKTLGCLKLKGILSPLNKHYRGKCCKKQPEEPVGAGNYNYNYNYNEPATGTGTGTGTGESLPKDVGLGNMEQLPKNNMGTGTSHGQTQTHTQTQTHAQTHGTQTHTQPVGTHRTHTTTQQHVSQPQTHTHTQIHKTRKAAPQRYRQHNVKRNVNGNVNRGFGQRRHKYNGRPITSQQRRRRQHVNKKGFGRRRHNAQQYRGRPRFTRKQNVNGKYNRQFNRQTRRNNRNFNRGHQQRRYNNKRQFNNKQFGNHRQYNNKRQYNGHTGHKQHGTTAYNRGHHKGHGGHYNKHTGHTQHGTGGYNKGHQQHATHQWGHTNNPWGHGAANNGWGNTNNGWGNTHTTGHHGHSDYKGDLTHGHDIQDVNLDDHHELDEQHDDDSLDDL